MGEIRTEVALETAGDREHFLRGGCEEVAIRQTSVEMPHFAGMSRPMLELSLT